MQNFTQTSDEKLFLLCRQYGELVLRYRNKFAGLLPEVYRRRLYKKKGFDSIFEFAAKLAGMSEEQVRRVLNLERRFEEIPILREMLVSGEVSANKLANQVKLLSCRALETLSRDVHVNTNLSQNPQNASRGTDAGGSGASSGARRSGNGAEELKLNSEVIQKLLGLQRKGIDISELILEFLNKREIKIAQEKERLAEESEQAARDRILAKNKQPSRHIPQSIKNLLGQEYGKKCAVPTCMKSYETIHHTRRFSLSSNHNPYFLAPLCEEHHAIAHSIDVKFHAKRNSRK